MAPTLQGQWHLPCKDSGTYQLAMQGAVAAKDLDTIEVVVKSSGGDAATVICYLHPGQCRQTQPLERETLEPLKKCGVSSCSRAARAHAWPSHSGK